MHIYINVHIAYKTYANLYASTNIRQMIDKIK